MAFIFLWFFQVYTRKKLYIYVASEPLMIQAARDDTSLCVYLDPCCY